MRPQSLEWKLLYCPCLRYIKKLPSLVDGFHPDEENSVMIKPVLKCFWSILSQISAIHFYKFL